MKFMALTVTLVLLTSGAAHAASGKAASHKAIDRPAARRGCLDDTHLLSHTAYHPAASMQPPSCGHLLSTDALLAVRHWDRT